MYKVEEKKITCGENIVLAYKVIYYKGLHLNAYQLLCLM